MDKIEVGKFYRTRDGQKARIYATDGGGIYPVHGATPHNNLWLRESWTLDGRHSIYTETSCDLVAEWVDAPVVDWAAMPDKAKFVAIDSDGLAWWYENKPVAYTGYWGSTDGWMGSIPDNHTPTFTGDWKDSLVERPKQ